MLEKELTDGHQEHEANGVKSNRFIRPNFVLVKPEEWVIVGDEVTKGRPTQVSRGEEHDANEVDADSLVIRSVSCYRD